MNLDAERRHCGADEKLIATSGNCKWRHSREGTLKNGPFGDRWFISRKVLIWGNIAVPFMKRITPTRNVLWKSRFMKCQGHFGHMSWDFWRAENWKDWSFQQSDFLSLRNVVHEWSHWDRNCKYPPYLSFLRSRINVCLFWQQKELMTDIEGCVHRNNKGCLTYWYSSRGAIDVWWVFNKMYSRFLS